MRCTAAAVAAVALALTAWTVGGSPSLEVAGYTASRAATRWTAPAAHPTARPRAWIPSESRYNPVRDPLTSFSTRPAGAATAWWLAGSLGLYAVAGAMFATAAGADSDSTAGPRLGQSLRRQAAALLTFALVWVASALPALAKTAAPTIPSGPSPVQQWAALLAPIFTVGLFVAPLEVVAAMVRAGSTGAYAVLPYLTMQANCTVWTLYALRLGDPSMLLPNAVGIALSTVTIGAYAVYSSAQRRPAVLRQAAVTVAGLGVLWGLRLPAATLGLIASVFSVSLFGAPLAELRQIVASADSSAMPFTQLLMGLLCAGAWTVYGACIGNLYVLVPNGLGAVLSVLQLGIWAKYRKAA